ncbi:methionine aminopeptidase [Intrasporangium sp.]|uniref:methionine aminopeptidase n=1 Tax=Intrasporangium sp. TaxID=1925024 RepID=UPI00293B39C4|nr:methionine aminopeptidase [Intrasporangium sp.]MDV3220807.1 methionine aminopeptidase [Intrasporangium sp.]
MSFWYNVRTGEVETDENRSRADEVMGPYETVEEARQALETARARTEKWDEEDREWEQKNAAPGWDDEGLDD